MAETVFKNKVIWGLAKAAWATVTSGTDGADVIGEPQTLVGSRKVTFTPSGDLTKVYADGTIIFTGAQNNGYEGSLEVTYLDEEFEQYILDQQKDDNGVLLENTQTTERRFALMWEWENDQKNTRHIMYRCTANRPNMDTTTAGDGGTKAAQYQTLTIVSVPRDDGIVKAKTTIGTNKTAYDAWFTTPYKPTITPPTEEGA